MDIAEESAFPPSAWGRRSSDLPGRWAAPLEKGGDNNPGKTSSEKGDKQHYYSRVTRSPGELHNFSSWFLRRRAEAVPAPSLPYKGWARGHAVIACSPQLITTSIPAAACAKCLETVHHPQQEHFLLSCCQGAPSRAWEKEGGTECSQLGGRAAVPQHPSGSLLWFSSGFIWQWFQLVFIEQNHLFGFQQHMEKSGHCSQAEMPPQRGNGWGCICPTTRYCSSKAGLDLLQLSISSKHLLHFFPLFVNHIHQIYCCQVDSKRYLPPKGPLQLKAKQAPDNPQETLWDINIPAVPRPE